MKKKPDEKINENNWLEFLENEKLMLKQRERCVERIQRVFTFLWIICVLVGVILTFFWCKDVGLILTALGVVFAFVCVLCSTYLMGRAEGRFENALAQQMLFEKTMKEKK